LLFPDLLLVSLVINPTVAGQPGSGRLAGRYV